MLHDWVKNSKSVGGIEVRPSAKLTTDLMQERGSTVQGLLTIMRKKFE